MKIIPTVCTLTCVLALYGCRYESISDIPVDDVTPVSEQGQSQSEDQQESKTEESGEAVIDTARVEALVQDQEQGSEQEDWEKEEAKRLEEIRKYRIKALKPLIDKNWIRLAQEYEIWIDRKNKTVIVGGTICFREGPLEMFACPAGTKEHESIVSINSSARLVHAGFLAIGAEPGKPVQWDPEHVPAKGPEVDVTVHWTIEEEKKEANAKEMVFDRTTDKPLEHNWVFCGSGEWKDPDTGEVYYYADHGDMICVSNFTTAMMDLVIESSNLNSGLRFVANTEKIPDLGTPVLLMLKPILDDSKDEKSAEKPDKKSTDKADKKDDGDKDEEN